MYYNRGMLEPSNEKRVIFPKGKQGEFLVNSKNSLNVTWGQFSRILQKSSRHLIDWKNEKYSISLSAVQTICDQLKRPFPDGVRIQNAYQYTSRAGREGGYATLKKYGRVGGDPNRRLAGWRKWWEKTGKNKPNIIANIRKPVRKPGKSKKLAEFIGILLGDGGITPMQITVTLHCRDDKEYIQYVAELMRNLFRVEPSISMRKRDQGSTILISRSNLVDYLVRSLGMKTGNKVAQQVDVPKWVKQNNAYLKACIRGLFDTDGCVVKHRYSVNGKIYEYKKLMFTNHSKPILFAVYDFLQSMGFNVRLSRDRNVWIDKQDHVRKYVREIGFHNPKHLNRYKN